jgi:hypothetical protein
VKPGAIAGIGQKKPRSLRTFLLHSLTTENTAAAARAFSA